MEGYVDQLNVDLENLLAAAKGKQMQHFPTQHLVDTLAGMGHNVNVHSIMTVLSGSPFVKSVTPEMVELSNDEVNGDEGGSGSQVDTKDQVEKMAQDNAGDIGQDLV